MLDLVLGGLLVVLAVRGWMRGLVKEVISLAVLIVGTIVSFRLSTPLGRIFSAMSGASPDASRLVAGMVIFLGIAIAAAVISKALHLGIRILPGVSTLNRAAGAGLSLIAFVLVVTICVSLATVVSLPEAVADELAASTVADALTTSDGMPQRVLGFISGDRVMEITLRIRNLTGDAQAVAEVDQPLTLPAAPASELERLPDAEVVLLDLLNRERVASDVPSLLRSPGLDQFAYDLAMEGYGTGTVSRYADEALRVRLDSFFLPSTARTELVVLAASPEGGHAALVDGPMVDAMGRELSKAGIAVVRGPLGLLIVEVVTG